MDAGLKAVADYGVTVVAIVVLTVAIAWLIRDLQKQRDIQTELARSAMAAFDRLVDQLDIEPVVRPNRRSRS